MEKFLPLCQEAARVGGEVLLRYAGKIAYREKGKHDLVTEADVASQQAIKQLVLGQFPDHDFLGEEDADALAAVGRSHKSPYRWIVDPLDGTTNFVHGLNNYAVSVALQHEGEIVCGAVFDPQAKECFAAAKGCGAMLNGKPIRVSDCRQLDLAMVAASFSPNVERGSLEIARFVEILHATQSVRRLGSAALNLCYIAAGRLDGYWATSVKIWDIAAGMLILTEAGGVISAFDGGALDLMRPEFAASASASLQKQFLETLATAKV